MLDLAIVGGGPGGLMSAWHLKKKLGELCRVTIFEASDRVGGKILTRKFDSAPAMYEAGVAEIYDYSMTGPDPLRELIQHFGLQTIPMDAEQVQLDGELLNDVPGMRRKYGPRTADAIEAFRKRCAGWYLRSNTMKASERTITSIRGPTSPARSCSTARWTIRPPSVSSRPWRGPMLPPKATTPTG